MEDKTLERKTEAIPLFLHTGQIPPLQRCQMLAGWMDLCGCILESGRINPHSLLIQRQRKAHVYLLMVKPSTLRAPICSRILSSLSASFSFPALRLTSWKVPGAISCFLIFCRHWLGSRGDKKGHHHPFAVVLPVAVVCLPVLNPHSFCFRRAHHWG